MQCFMQQQQILQEKSTDEKLLLLLYVNILIHGQLIFDLRGFSIVVDDPIQ